MNKFDIIIPVARKDVSFLCHTVKSLLRNIIGVDNIYVISNINNKDDIVARCKDYGNVIFLNENMLVDGLTFFHIKKLLKVCGSDGIRTGWYFQQLLKYAYAFTPYAKEFYLSWDADTLALQPINFFIDRQPVFTQKNEYHEPYFNTMRRILGIEKMVDFSFIAEHMMFKTSIVRQMCLEMERMSCEGTLWFDVIIQACDFNDKRGNLFSEFETYGNFVMKNYPPPICFSETKHFPFRRSYSRKTN